MINGTAFDWESITVTLPSGPVFDIESIEYSETQEIQEVYGKGRKPRRYSRGNYAAEGKLTVLREEWEQIRKALIATAPVAKRRLLNHAPFTVAVNYSNDDQPSISDFLWRCVLTSDGTSSSQNDPKTSVEVSFKILGGIAWAGENSI